MKLALNAVLILVIVYCLGMAAMDLWAILAQQFPCGLSACG